MCAMLASPAMLVLLVLLAFLTMPFGVAATQAQSFDSRRSPLLELDTNPAAILTHVPGVFAYTFGAAGWPDGISPFGMNPNRVSLSMEGLTLNDLLTGRPRYDLAPGALISSIRMTSDSAIKLEVDSLNQSEPLTNLRYQSAGGALQAVQAVHVQNRSFVAKDSTLRRVQYLFGYSGAAARGEYDGSRLKRARSITFRVRYMTPRWSVEVLEMARRRSVGAHTGVIPFTGATYESIYQRLGATVGDTNARRRTIRNDLQLTGRTTLSEISTIAKIFWSVQTLDFSGDLFELKGVAKRLGAQVDMSRPLGKSQARVLVNFWNDRFVDGTGYEQDPDSRAFYSVLGSIQGSLDVFEVDYDLQAGPEGDDAHSWIRASGSMQRSFGPFSVSGSFLHAGISPSNHELTGFGSAVVPITDRSLSTLNHSRVGLNWRSDWLSALVEGFTTRQTDALVSVLNETTEVITVRSVSGTSVTNGVSLRIGIRDEGQHGIYAILNPVLSTRSSDEISTRASAWQRALPEAWSSARLGLRTILFTGDLDLDAYIRARYWGEMGGLRMHPVTGLVVLPESTDEILESNWLIDIVAEAGVRGATFFISYENMFSGTTAQVGNLIVPDYPLPHQRTRFGVYWPISN